MNAMAEKLEDAGIDTLGARLTVACVEAIRQHPDSSVDAWRCVGRAFGHDFIRGLMNDMQRNMPAAKFPQTPLSRAIPSVGISAPYKPRVIPQERVERRLQLQRVVRSKYRNSGDVPWSDVGWHELNGLKRDGKEAVALLEAGPGYVPNDGRTVGSVLGIEKTDQIIAGIRKGIGPSTQAD